MKAIKKNIVLILVLFSNDMYGQGSFTLSTNKAEYSYGEKIIVEMTFQNNTDSALSFWSDPYCITELSFVGTQLNLICSTADGVFHFSPGKSQTWYWVIDPRVHGVPTQNGEQKIIGSFLNSLHDTVSFNAPKYYGGQLRVRIKNGINNDALTSLKDSVNATVIQDNGCNDYGCDQIWQIEGYSIDSLVTALNSDYRFSRLEVWRPIMLESTVVSKVTDRKTIPDKCFLYQNYPNPFNPTTSITYSITKGGNVNLKVHNIVGEEVSHLVNEYQKPGIYKVSFDGSALSSGIYFYSITINEFVKTKKMILLR